MLIKSTLACAPFIANDGCRIREVLHPSHDPVDLPYSLAVAEVEPGAGTFRHRLRQDEVYYLLAGTGRMHVDLDARIVGAGDVVHIPGGAVQWIENVGAETLRFLALVSPAWTAADDERL
ncbi:MAG: cupin domain-containing protein [Gammaproteobacteria bacterium]